MCVYMFSLNAYINSERQVLEEKYKIVCCVCSATQLCPTLCDPVDYSLPDSSVHGNSPGKNTGLICHARLQGIFPNQGSNPGLPQLILYHQSHQGSLRMLQWYPIPSPENLPNSGIKPGSAASQMDSLPSQPSGKP